MLLFLILSIQFGFIFATTPILFDLPVQDSRDGYDYECGKVFIPYSEVKDAMLDARKCLDKGYYYPERYKGGVFGKSKEIEYFLYPISTGRLSSANIKDESFSFGVVFTRDEHEPVDVVARIPKKEFHKCIRRRISYIGQSQSNLVPAETNGHMCGHQFFPDAMIAISHDYSKTKRNKDYPKLIDKKFSPKYARLWMWPIMRDKILYTKGNTKIKPYYLVITLKGELVDVVVSGYLDNYLSCVRSREIQTAPLSDPLTKLFPQPPKNGFLCGKTFFSDEILLANAEIVIQKVERKGGGKYPEKHIGYPYRENWVWPLMNSGELYTIGGKAPYRFLLRQDYKEFSVAVIDNNKFKMCERIQFSAIKNHDTSGYNCFEKVFSHEQLVAAADAAYAKLNTDKKNSFPARYNDPESESKEFYFTYPLIHNGIFGLNARYPGPHRVVLRTNFEIVGAITSFGVAPNEETIDEERKFMKCHRLYDGQLPQDYFSQNLYNIRETHITY